MKATTFVLLTIASTVPLAAQNRTTAAQVDEAFRLAGIVNLIQSAPSRLSDVAAADSSGDISLKFFSALSSALMGGDPDVIAERMRANFGKRYDGGKMGTFMALERTTTFRSMRYMEDNADTPTAKAELADFQASLKSGIPNSRRVELLRKLDDAMNISGIHARIVASAASAMSNGLGLAKPSNQEAQNDAYIARIRPAIADVVLRHNLFVYRNADDAALESYVSSLQNGVMPWFYHNLELSLVSVISERASRASVSIKNRIAQEYK